MGKKSKPSKSPIEEAEVFIEDTGTKRRDKKEVAEREAAERAKVEAIVHKTEECLFYVTQSIDGARVVHPDRYLATSEAWARTIHDLVVAWRAYPKWSVTSHQRIPGQFAGYRAARHIWTVASGRSSIEELAAVIAKARESLGPMEEGLDHRETEDGIRAFFRVLREKFLEYERKSPPAAGPKSRRELPPPTPRALSTAKAEVAKMARGRRLRAADMIRLYRLEGVTEQEFRRSSKYIQRNSKVRRTPWQLPFVVGRSSERRELDGTLGEGRWWTPGEAKKAIEGWTARLRK